MWLNGINSGQHRIKTKNMGRELVRRQVLWAYEKGFQKIETSIFVSGAASFFYGLGFRNIRSVKYSWNKANSFDQGEVEIWKMRLEQAPDHLGEFAQTKIGRAVLHYDPNRGELDLTDNNQVAFAFDRLHLPLAFKRPKNILFMKNLQKGQSRDIPRNDC